MLIHHPKDAVYPLRVSQRRKNVIVHHVYLFGGFLKTTEEIKINYNETRMAKDREDLHGLPVNGDLQKFRLNFSRCASHELLL